MELDSVMQVLERAQATVRELRQENARLRAQVAAGRTLADAVMTAFGYEGAKLFDALWDAVKAYEAGVADAGAGSEVARE